MNVSKDYQTVREAARYLGTNELTLKRRRRAGFGPVWERHNGRVSYRTTDLILFNLAGIEI